MAIKFKNLFDKLSDNYEHTPQTFAQLDTEKLKAKMRLKEDGQTRGASNLPPETATTLDDIEQKIVSFVNDEVKSSVETYYDHLNTFEVRINRLHAAGHVGTMQTIADVAEGNFQALIRKDSSTLYTAKRAVAKREEDMKAFKATNSLKRAAYYPASRFMYFAIALLLIAFETLINGMFFAQGHELGLLGGGFTALIPSMMNVCLGYYLGNFACRLAINTHQGKRWAGVILCLLLPLLMLSINLLVAHYRSAMMSIDETSSAIAAKVALESFRTHLFELQDVESWLLFGTGCVFCLISTLDFWKMDDPYLRYGEITREYEERLADYADQKAACLEDLEHLRDESLSELGESSNLINAKVNEANSVVDAQARWKVLFVDHLKHLESVGRELLGYYRTMNLSKRAAEAPAYFNKEWKLSRQQLPEAGVDFLSTLEGFKSETVDMKDAYARCSDRISKAYIQALEAYRTIEQLNQDEPHAS